MKVHICDFCKTIINNPMDRNIVKVKKRTPSIDFATVWGRDYFWREDYFRNNKYTLCPQCYENMLSFIDIPDIDSIHVDMSRKSKSPSRKRLTNFARMKRAKSAEEMAEILVEPYIKKRSHEDTPNLIIQGLLDWLEAEVKE